VTEHVLVTSDAFAPVGPAEIPRRFEALSIAVSSRYGRVQH